MQTVNGLAVFEIGPAAEKWREKILHPKTRIEKIGVKPGAKVSLLGNFDADFLDELKPLAGSVTKDKVAADSDTIFFAADSVKELSSVSKIAKSLKGATAMWIVYPKGQKTHHRERRDRRRTQNRTERCESCRLFRDAYRVEIRPPANQAISRTQTQSRFRNLPSGPFSLQVVQHAATLFDGSLWSKKTSNGIPSPILSRAIRPLPSDARIQTRP